MKPLLLIAAFLIFVSTSFAQKGKIEGKITDSKTGNPLAGVSVFESVIFPSIFPFCANDADMVSINAIISNSDFMQ